VIGWDESDRQAIEDVKEWQTEEPKTLIPSTTGCVSFN
jgi:hypothetical protein